MIRNESTRPVPTRLVPPSTKFLKEGENPTLKTPKDTTVFYKIGQGLGYLFLSYVLYLAVDVFASKNIIPHFTYIEVLKIYFAIGIFSILFKRK